jgi:hypothetical protein
MEAKASSAIDVVTDSFSNVNKTYINAVTFSAPGDSRRRPDEDQRGPQGPVRDQELAQGGVRNSQKAG